MAEPVRYEYDAEIVKSNESGTTAVSMLAEGKKLK
jgi:hypothetical protein